MVKRFALGITLAGLFGGHASAQTPAPPADCAALIQQVRDQVANRFDSGAHAALDLAAQAEKLHTDKKPADCVAKVQEAAKVAGLTRELGTPGPHPGRRSPTTRIRTVHEEGTMSRMQEGLLTALLAVGVAFLAGCASAPPLTEQALTKALAPMPQPQRAVGYKVVRIRDGKEEVNTLVAQTTETQTWTDSSGCRMVLPRTGFGPALEFSNCDGSTGTQRSSSRAGARIPSPSGGTWVYSYAGTNTRGDRWTGQRHCEVAGTARVKAGAAEHDAYKIVCEDNGATRRPPTHITCRRSCRLSSSRSAIGCGTGRGLPRPIELPGIRTAGVARTAGMVLTRRSPWAVFANDPRRPAAARQLIRP